MSKHTHHQFLTLPSGGSGGRSKFTTRHLAALDFLLHVPMSRETEIRHAGIISASQAQQLEETEEGEVENKETAEREEQREGESIEGSSRAFTPNGHSSGPITHTINTGLNPYGALSTPLHSPMGTNGEINDTFPEFAGKKLKGPNPPVGKIPPSIRHGMSRLTEQSALCRQWEEHILNTKQITQTIESGNTSQRATNGEATLLESRIFFSRARSYPLMICSVIKYDAVEEKARIEKMKAEDSKGLEVYDLPHRDWRGFSYKPLFKQIQEDENGFLYDPDSLDDPNMLYGSHRFVSTRSASTGPVLSSIILYVNKEKLRESLNEQYQERHPNLPPSLTLSKIRNIKKKILVFCVNTLHIELSTIALAMINFERLCLKGFVSKVNRKLSMAVSMLLAYKFSENYSHQKHHKTMENLLEYFDQEWDLPKKQVFEAEFGAYIHLGFSLHVPHQHLVLMYRRLLKLINKTSKQYLGEDMEERFIEDIMNHEHNKEQIRIEKERAEEEQQLKQEQEEERVLQDELGDVHTPLIEGTTGNGSNRSGNRMPSFWSMGKKKNKALLNTV